MENLAKVFEFHKRDNRLTFLGVGIKNKQAVEGSNFIKFELEDEVLGRIGSDSRDDVSDEIFWMDDNVTSKHYKDFCSIYGNLGDVVLVDCGGNYIGEYVEDGQSYQYDEDGVLNTTYGVLAESLDQLTEEEQNAIFITL